MHAYDIKFVGINVCGTCLISENHKQYGIYTYLFVLFVADSNLFADAATTIENYENFSLKVHPDFYGEAFRGKPSDYKFYILSRASHKVSSITLMLCDVFLVNKLKFEAYSDSWREDGNFDEIKEPFSYKIEVSKDSNSWMTVIDHSNCKCYFTQQLYFPRKAVQ